MTNPRRRRLTKREARALIARNLRAQRDAERFSKRRRSAEIAKPEIVLEELPSGEFAWLRPAEGES